MRGRRIVVFAATSMVAATLLIWVLLPYLFPPLYHTIDIAMEYRNFLLFPVATNMVNVRDLVPSGISLPAYTSTYVSFALGLLHMEIEGKSYDAVSLTLTHGILKNFQVPPILDSKGAGYFLGFFTNNSELGEVLHSYGLTHTYVKATYRTIKDGAVNWTLLTLTYPNGSLLADISYKTSGEVEPWETGMKPSDYGNSYYLRDDNLTVLRLRREAAPFRIFRPSPEGIGRLNMTTSDGSVIWRVLGRVEYTINILLTETYPLYRQSGKIGWIQWK